eukprot:1157766-Pelagomonas_calceolata.AAC.3
MRNADDVCMHCPCLSDVTVEQLTNINPDIAGQKVSEGQTILLPANKLSVRDKEILEGIGEGKGDYRMYPVRKGETINDITSKRGINMTEMQSLNPGTDLQHLSGKPGAEGGRS